MPLGASALLTADSSRSTLDPAALILRRLLVRRLGAPPSLLGLRLRLLALAFRRLGLLARRGGTPARLVSLLVTAPRLELELLGPPSRFLGLDQLALDQARAVQRTVHRPAMTENRAHSRYLLPGELILGPDPCDCPTCSPEYGTRT